MKVLVTGAGGYIGSHLVELLSSMPDISINAVIRPGGDDSKLRRHGASVYPVDLAKRQNLADILDNVDCIYHLAAGTSGSHYEMMLNTVVATENLVDECLSHHIKRFVLVSSLSVYRMTALKQRQILDENCPMENNLAARDSYTIVKVRQEKLLRERCQKNGLNHVIVRPGKIYGPGDFPIPPQLGLKIPGICYLYIGGNNILPLTHVVNCAQAVVNAGIVDGIDGEIINVIDDNLPTQKEFLKLYESIMGKLKRRIRIPYRGFILLALVLEAASRKTKGNIPPLITRYRAANLWKDLLYDNSKAKRCLEWTPVINPSEGIKDMLLATRKGTCES